MHKEMWMNVLRRNDDAMKNCSPEQKQCLFLKQDIPIRKQKFSRLKAFGF